MRIKYRKDIGENKFVEIELDGTLAELSALSMAFNQVDTFVKSAFGSDAGYVWSTLKEMAGI